MLGALGAAGDERQAGSPVKQEKQHVPALQPVLQPHGGAKGLAISEGADAKAAEATESADGAGAAAEPAEGSGRLVRLVLTVSAGGGSTRVVARIQFARAVVARAVAPTKAERVRALRGPLLQLEQLDPLVKQARRNCRPLPTSEPGPHTQG